ncbi:LmeA family phospholipid-binding protein [Propionibacterium freudenreichii]|uniref:LmeA family phospholipid-binding protein n=1 Tax=Propionibacterium freudenreichii TaxID=1744 RepID=UPI000BC2EF13|nr:LmeA family phospholipid-binding protein [Propionibacterium freudenreichii]MDK9661175.1 LmeA family phospholipid-binding protein [Propionibacterium freudenreichii]SBT28992.1 Hypothetical protein PFR_JS14_833 [Propionibacterium freudenreichii]
MSRSSHRGRDVIIFIMVLALLGVAVMVVDHVVRDRAEQATDDKLTAKVGTLSEVHTRITDPVFLASAVQNKVSGAELTLGSFTLTGGTRTVHVSSATVNLHNVSPLTKPAEATVESLDAAVTVDWATLSSLTGVQLSYADDGRAAGSTNITAGSQTIPIQVTASLNVNNPHGQLGLVSPSATLAGVDVPSDVIAGATKAFQDKLTLPTVGDGLSYSSVTLTEQGATLGVHGDHVDLGKLKQ